MKQGTRQKIIPLKEKFTQEELDRLLKFRARFQELWQHFEELKKSGLDLNGSFELTTSKVVEGGKYLGISRFRIKGFLADYRHFSGQGEPANFLAILKLLARRCRDTDLKQILDENKSEWQRASLLAGWHNDFTVDEIVNAIFNEDVFHSRQNKENPRVTLGDIQERLSQSAVWAEMVHITYARMLIVRNVNWIIDPAVSGEPALRIPANKVAKGPS